MKTDITQNAPRFSDYIKDRKKKWSDANSRPSFVPLLGNKNGILDFLDDHHVDRPKIIGAIEDIHQLDNLEGLPSNYVLKPLSGSNNRGVFIVKNGVELFSNERMSIEFVRKSIARLEVGKFGTRFRVEERLDDWSDGIEIPLDFKFYMFAGELAFLHIVRREIDEKSHWFFNKDLSPLLMQIQKTQLHSSKPFVMPPFIQEMVDLATRLGTVFQTFMRVDLYATNRGPVFGEFTPYPHGGNGYTEEANITLGEKWYEMENAD